MDGALGQSWGTLGGHSQRRVAGGPRRADQPGRGWSTAMTTLLRLLASFKKLLLAGAGHWACVRGWLDRWVAVTAFFLWRFARAMVGQGPSPRGGGRGTLVGAAKGG